MKYSHQSAAAYHEAGHAVMSLRNGYPVASCSIQGGIDSSGTVFTGVTEFAPEAHLAQIRQHVKEGDRKVAWLYAWRYSLIVLAGPVSELVKFPRSKEASNELINHRANLDLELVRTGLGWFSDEKLRIIETEAARLLKQNWKSVEAVVKALLHEMTIDGAKLRRIFRLNENDGRRY